MEFSVTSMIAIPISTFCSVKSYNISYGDSCFGVIEVCHTFFWVYHVWCGTGIRDKYVSVVLLVWCFCNKQFFVNYIFCDVFCRLFFGLFLLVAILFFFIRNFVIISFLLGTFIPVVCWFSSFFSSDSLSWHGQVLIIIKFWYVYTLSMI